MARILIIPPSGNMVIFKCEIGPTLNGMCEPFDRSKFKQLPSSKIFHPLNTDASDLDRVLSLEEAHAIERNYDVLPTKICICYFHFGGRNSIQPSNQSY